MKPDDLTGLIRAVGRIGDELGPRERQVSELVVNFNTTMAALASEPPDLQESVAELGPTVRTAYDEPRRAERQPAGDRARSPARSSRASSRRSRRSTRSRPGSRRSSRSSASRSSADCWTTSCRRRRRSRSATSRGIPSIQSGDLFSKCIRDVIIPAGDKVLPDGDFTSGKPNYQEFWYAMVGLTGEGSELRRQRAVRPRPDRRRHVPGDAQGRDASTAARCTATRSASRSARSPPGRPRRPR